MRRPWPTSTPRRWRRRRGRSSTRRRRSSRRNAAPEEDSKRLAGGEEVAASEHREDALPVLERGLRHRSARREPGRGDEDVQPAVGEHGAAGHLLDGVLARHIHLDGESATGSMGRRSSSATSCARLRCRSATTTCAPRAASCRAAARPMPLAAARDDRDAACELPARGRLRELVALERPVLDRERLRFRSERNPPSASAASSTAIAR